VPDFAFQSALWAPLSDFQHADVCLFCCSLAWIEMRMVVVSLLREFDLVALGRESEDWIERQRVFFLWERLPLHVQIRSVGGDVD
jgi:hypothetical protein